MTVEETLELARSHGVEVSLNEAGDGVDLEIEADPPQALVNVLRRAKWASSPRCASVRWTGDAPS